jgi:hypothetical protein
MNNAKHRMAPEEQEDLQVVTQTHNDIKAKFNTINDTIKSIKPSKNQDQWDFKA